jgi:hypothetical protein
MPVAFVGAENTGVIKKVKKSCSPRAYILEAGHRQQISKDVNNLDIFQ